MNHIRKMDICGVEGVPHVKVHFNASYKDDKSLFVIRINHAYCDAVGRAKMVYFMSDEA